MADPVPYARDDPKAQPPHYICRFQSLGRARAFAAADPRPTHADRNHGTIGRGRLGKLVGPAVTDLTRQHNGEALGERIIVSGRVLDENGRPVPNTLIEILQAQCGRPLRA